MLLPNVFLMEYIGFCSPATVIFSQRKYLPRSTPSSTVTVCIYFWHWPCGSKESQAVSIRLDGVLADNVGKFLGNKTGKLGKTKDTFSIFVSLH
jgi:hypothetical protein